MLKGHVVSQHSWKRCPSGSLRETPYPRTRNRWRLRHPNMGSQSHSDAPPQLPGVQDDGQSSCVRSCFPSQCCSRSPQIHKPHRDVAVGPIHPLSMPPMVLPAGRLMAQAHRMTSSAWKRRDGGIVKPSAWAVLRLMTSRNVVGRSMGKSAGVAPLRIFSTKTAQRRPMSTMFGP